MHINKKVTMTLGIGMALYSLDIGLTVTVTLVFISYTDSTVFTNLFVTCTFMALSYEITHIHFFFI